MTRLEALLQEMKGHVKQANVTSPEQVLGGDRTDFKGGNKPHEGGVVSEEMNNSSFHTPDPTNKCYDPKVSTANPIHPDTKKANELANKIIAEVNKEDNKKEEEEEIEKTVDAIVEQIKEEKDDKEDGESKKAGVKEFFSRLISEGPDFLHKCAASFDEEYQAIPDYLMGKMAADQTLMVELNKQASYPSTEQDYLIGAQLAEQAMTKVGMARDEQDYLLGAQLAEQAMMKVAADLVSVQPLLQELFATGVISQQEKDALAQALGSQEVLTPEIITQIVMSIVGNEEVAQQVIKQTELPVAPNVIPAPAQPISVPMLPANNQTQRDEQLVVQAALKILDKYDGKKGK